MPQNVDRERRVPHPSVHTYTHTQVLRRRGRPWTRRKPIVLAQHVEVAEDPYIIDATRGRVTKCLARRGPRDRRRRHRKSRAKGSRGGGARVAAARDP